MRLLVFEFITGGGLLNTPLPAGLAREGEAMLRQLLNDLGECDGVEVIEVLRDPRLPGLSGDRFFTTFVRGDFNERLDAACRRADLVLPIAPETGGVLLELSELIVAAGSGLLGSRPAAVRLATSKRATCALLSQRGIATVPTFAVAEAPDPGRGRWVIKPDDGAGGEGCRIMNGRPVDVPAGWIIQPLTAGRAASLTLLCHRGRADVYACNVQHVTLDEHGCRLRGVEVNGLAREASALQALAADIAAAIPDLWGWVGVDLILDATGPRVLEINPRLTTAYVGLHESLQCNPAALLLELQREQRLPRPPGRGRRPVEV